MVGYEQSYLSALEIGLKGPPTREFVQRLVDVLSLSEAEQSELEESLRASQRKFTLPLKAEEDVFRLANRFWEKLPNLSPAQIRIIEDLLGIEDARSVQRSPSTRLATSKEARM